MSPKKKDAEPVEDQPDQRATDVSDQDVAFETAFATGRLPEEDRRGAEDQQVTLAAEGRNEAARRLFDIVNGAFPGSTFRRERDVWRVHLVDEGGTPIDVSGPTIADAVASHGAQVEHAVFSVPL